MFEIDLIRVPRLFQDNHYVVEWLVDLLVIDPESALDITRIFYWMGIGGREI